MPVNYYVVVYFDRDADDYLKPVKAWERNERVGGGARREVPGDRASWRHRLLARRRSDGSRLWLPRGYQPFQTAKAIS
ncbi:MAG TPA: hypothetical protein VKS78_09560 [Roseiarcus sp.]|nr:hypothetical protein [Roseiarcus sp.]